METKERIADRVNLDTIHYERITRSKTDKAIVSFGKTAGTLHFNPKMVELLNMKDWKQVVVGYDKSSEVIVLKQCDAEEYGAVLVKNAVVSGRDKKYEERGKRCRVIGIKHLVKSIVLTTTKHYKAERDGTMIFLEALGQNE